MWWPGPCDLFEAGPGRNLSAWRRSWDCSPSLISALHVEPSIWGENGLFLRWFWDNTCHIFKAYHLWDWVIVSQVNPNLSRCQLHKYDFLCVKQISKARKQLDWQTSVSTASSLSPLRFMALEFSLLSPIWLGQKPWHLQNNYLLLLGKAYFFP